MIHILDKVRNLEAQGKLHKTLLLRVRVMFALSALLGLAVLYNVLFRDAGFLVAGLFSAIGFAAGYSLFSRMNAVQWDEKKEVLQAGRMDVAGFVALGGYIGFEILFRTLIKDVFPAEATAYVLATIFGTLLGRAVGTVIEIHRVSKGGKTK